MEIDGVGNELEDTLRAGYLSLLKGCLDAPALHERRTGQGQRGAR